MSFTTKHLIILLIFAIPLLLAQAAWMFQDARKRGEKYYWLWGLFGLMHFPQSILVYLIVTRVIMEKKDKKKDNN
jgi:ABC-type Co2+ transport system permease subunit